MTIERESRAQPWWHIYEQARKETEREGTNLYWERRKTVANRLVWSGQFWKKKKSKISLWIQQGACAKVVRDSTFPFFSMTSLLSINYPRCVQRHIALQRSRCYTRWTRVLITYSFGTDDGSLLLSSFISLSFSTLSIRLHLVHTVRASLILTLPQHASCEHWRKKGRSIARHSGTHTGNAYVQGRPLFSRRIHTVLGRNR